MPQTQTQPKKPCTELQNQTGQAKQVLDASHSIEGPFLFALVPAGSAAVVGTMGYATGLACVPEPGAIVACPAMILVSGGALVTLAILNYHYFANASSTWKKLNPSPTPPGSSDACGG